MVAGRFAAGAAPAIKRASSVAQNLPTTSPIDRRKPGAGDAKGQADPQKTLNLNVYCRLLLNRRNIIHPEEFYLQATEIICLEAVKWLAHLYLPCWMAWTSFSGSR
jgi:hypothetical protein